MCYFILFYRDGRKCQCTEESKLLPNQCIKYGLITPQSFSLSTESSRVAGFAPFVRDPRPATREETEFLLLERPFFQLINIVYKGFYWAPKQIWTEDLIIWQVILSWAVQVFCYLIQLSHPRAIKITKKHYKCNIIFCDECFYRIINLTCDKIMKNDSAKRLNQVKTYESQLKVYA